MARMQRDYEEALGIRLPERYSRMNDADELRRLAAAGDRHAAVRLGQLLGSQGDFEGAVAAYRRAAELGAVAPLAEAAQWLDPGSADARRYLDQQFGHVPEANFAQAYSDAYAAYMGAILMRARWWTGCAAPFRQLNWRITTVARLPLTCSCSSSSGRILDAIHR